jgi:hypothetical protein
MPIWAMAMPQTVSGRRKRRPMPPGPARRTRSRPTPKTIQVPTATPGISHTVLFQRKKNAPSATSSAAAAAGQNFLRSSFSSALRHGAAGASGMNSSSTPIIGAKVAWK